MNRPASLAGIPSSSTPWAVAVIACCHAAGLLGAGALLAQAPQTDLQTDPSAGSPAVAPADFGIGQPAQPSFERKAPPPASAGSGWLGLSVDDSLVTGRLIVVEVTPEGPAAGAGIAPRDALLAINGTPLRTADELAAALAAISPGMDVKMAIGKGDRIDELTVTAVPRPRERPAPAWQAVAEAAPPPQPEPQAPFSAPQAPTSASPPPWSAPQPQAFAPAPVAAPAPRPEMLPAPAQSRAAPLQPSAQPAAGPKGRTALGVRTIPVDSATQVRFQLPEQRGALVIGVVHELPASKAGVPPGSVIVAIDNQPVRSPDDLTRIVTSGPVGAPLPLQYVLPGGEARRAEVMLQPIDEPLERALVGQSP